MLVADWLTLESSGTCAFGVGRLNGKISTLLLLVLGFGILAYNFSRYEDVHKVSVSISSSLSLSSYL